MNSFLFGACPVIILLGAPGAGKGTQAVFLRETYHLPHISTGDLFRENLKTNSPIGQKAKAYMEKGALVPDEVVCEMLFERLSKADCKNGYILDGFPRSLAQAKLLDEALKNTSQVLVLDIEVDDATIIERLSGRLTCEACGTPFHALAAPPQKEGCCDKCGGKLIQRKDDAEAIIKERLSVYHSQTEPLKEFYKQKGWLVEIDGKQPKERITAQIKELLTKKGC